MEPISPIRPDGRRPAIFPADVKGRFITARRAVFAVLLVIYLAAPLVKIGGHPAVHLDVAARRFFLFGASFNAQDFWIVAFLLTGFGFALLFATAWLGRVWCGWACPQTVLLEGLYRPIERWTEGSRERRFRDRTAPWTAAKVGRKILKHGLYLLVSWGIAHVALSLFLSAKELAWMVLHGPAGNEAAFGWAIAVTGALYFNFAWFREQLCVLVCPYGRLQSALIDRDSMIVGYDAKRGEPRGKLQKQPVAEPVNGDCVDCNRCVVVCPMGIDIRNGLQMECIACAQCIDACDDVMEKVGKPKGLIRYASLNVLDQQPHRVLRPRLYAYGALAAVFVVGLVLSLVERVPFEANLLRFKGAPYVVDGAQVRNQFELHLVNKEPSTAHFEVKVKSSTPASVVVPWPEGTLASLESVRVPIFVSLDRESARAAQLEVEVAEGGHVRTLPMRFLSPP